MLLGDGVMAAQVPLEHLVEVQVLVPQPLLGSTMAVQETVNFEVVGSSPTRAARKI